MPTPVSTSPSPPKFRYGGHIGNGFSETTRPLLKVKRLSNKAILPLRASPLSIGYDLSSSSIGAGVEALDRRWSGRGGCGLQRSYWGDFVQSIGCGFQGEAQDRIAQLIIERIMTLELVEVDDLDSTVRSVGGFGCTGVRQKNAGKQ
ncbi:Deoxyuridine 5'-triphosphate nucleotidohydrolase [Acorus gramineus]|uniref:dUTP diphosphatase n=1 Tax=Acorus gramineus TaxID=55184 RepID=A0AAV9AH49_ACOGR|nr:Deoxyuridine 5'-triphosphate nucleotidohydrolase [Acorus gramineus]